jgi:hypothetical protein
MSSSNQTKAAPLIGHFDTMGPGALSDEFLAIAHNVEMALRNAGGIPGKDYKLLDLFQLAQPIVVALIEKGRITEWDYPADRTVPGKG